jgi:hypothetical protein
LKTSDFNNTKASLVDTTSLQDINSVKRFFQPISLSNAGSGSIKIYPQDFQIGEASIQYFRYADAATPQMGDTWIVRSRCFQRLWSDTAKVIFFLVWRPSTIG